MSPSSENDDAHRKTLICKQFCFCDRALIKKNFLRNNIRSAGDCFSILSFLLNISTEWFNRFLSLECSIHDSLCDELFISWCSFNSYHRHIIERNECRWWLAKSKTCKFFDSPHTGKPQTKDTTTTTTKRTTNI